MCHLLQLSGSSVYLPRACLLRFIASQILNALTLLDFRFYVLCGYGFEHVGSWELHNE